MVQQENLYAVAADETAQNQSNRYLRGGVIGLASLMALGLAGLGLRGQLTVASVGNIENKNFGGQLFLQEGAQLITGNMDSIGPALNYAGLLKVRGFISVFSQEVSAGGGAGTSSQAYQQILWNLYGVDPRCVAPNREILPKTVGPNALPARLKYPDSCLITINQGTSCFAPPGEKYFDGAAFPHGSDGKPVNIYSSNTYSAFKQYHNGISGYDQATPIVTAQGGTTLRTGLGIQQIQGHVVMIHDYEGNAIACGKLTTAGNTNPSYVSLTLAPTPPPTAPTV